MAAALIALAAVGFLIWNRATSGANPAPAPGFRLLVDCDISGSMGAEEKRANLGAVEATFSRVLPSDSQLTFWAFGQEAWELYQGKPLVVRELWPLLDRIQRSRTSRPGTSPAEVLSRNLEAAKQAGERGEGVAIMLLWDGEDTDPAATRRAVKELAELPHLAAVWVAGLPADPGSGVDARGQARQAFAALDDRLICSGPFDTQAGLDRFRERLQSRQPRVTESGSKGE